MDSGECSTSTAAPAAAGGGSGTGYWAKLVPSDAEYPEVLISAAKPAVRSRVVVGDEGEAVVWCEITPLHGLDGKAVARVRNLSSEAFLVDGNVIRDEMVDIKAESEIIPGPTRDGFVAYTLKTIDSRNRDNSIIKIHLDVEHAKCSICLNVWHDVVTAAPCLHNFCNGCFSELMRKSSTRSHDRTQTVSCPQCRTTVQSVGKNHFLQNIEEAILQACPSLKRSDDEIELLDSYASVKMNLVLGGRQKNQSRKRPFSYTGDEINSDLPCPQCGVELCGFRCIPGSSHLICSGCGGMMPSRPTLAIPQKCTGCNRNFCGAYWHSQGVDRGQYNLICGRETIEAISGRSITRVPDSAHENNPYERDITERCIQQSGRTVQAVISEWVVKFDANTIDRSRLQLNHADSINSNTNLCSDCYFKFIDFLLYWYRVTLPSCQLPRDAADRDDCWYGYACRTQHHKIDHAKKMNHVCRPTRGGAHS